MLICRYLALLQIIIQYKVLNLPPRTTPLMPFVAGSLTSALSKNSYRERFTNLPHTITLNDIKGTATESASPTYLTPSH